MLGHLVEYVVAPRQGGGWIISRSDVPLGRRRALVDALDFATHLAEREALVHRHATRVTMEPTHAQLAIDDQWRRAA